jgi:hypothetical protein
LFVCLFYNWPAVDNGT